MFHLKVTLTDQNGHNLYKSISNVVKQSKKHETPMAYMILLTPEGNFDFSSLGVTDQQMKTEQPTVKERYRERLMQKYADRFIEKLPEGVPPVRWPGAEMKIDVDLDGKPPPATSPYKLNVDQLKELKKQLKYYLEVGFIRPSSSPYASPVLFAPKKRADGTFDGWRFCCDYRNLNKYTRRNMTPLPPIDQIIEQLTGAKMFSKLDLTQYYHQFPLLRRM